MLKGKYKITTILSLFATILAITACLGGLLSDSLYLDAKNIKTVWFVNDLVTLFIVIPFLIGSIAFTLKGSIKAQLVWVGILWYMIYNYIFYVYGAVFNSFFLIYVAIVIVCAYALIFLLMKIDVKTIGKSFSNKTPVRWISGYLFFFASFLGIPWIVMSLSFIFTGKLNNVTDGVVFATDLIFLISVLIVSGILLWIKNYWGYILSFMILIKSILYPIVLVIGGFLAYKNNGIWDSFIPLYILLWAGSIFAFFALYKNISQRLTE